MLTRGYLSPAQLEALPPGARVIDEDGDILERLPDGRWIVIAVPDGVDPAFVGDIWPTRLLRARRYPSGR